MSALSQALAGDVAAWRGEQIALDALDARWAEDPVPQPRGVRAFRVLHGTRDAPPLAVDAWIPMGSEEVASIDFAPAAPVDLAGLGEPERVLDSNHFEVGAVVSDRLFADRGVTLSVAEPFDGGEPSVVRVQLYAATTPQEYVTEIGQTGVALRPSAPPG